MNSIQEWVSVTDLSAGFPVGQITHARSFKTCTQILMCKVRDCIQQPWETPSTPETGTDRAKAPFHPSFFLLVPTFKNLWLPFILWSLRLDEASDCFTLSVETHSSFIYCWHHVQLSTSHCTMVKWGLNIYLMSPHPEP